MSSKSWRGWIGVMLAFGLASTGYAKQKNFLVKELHKTYGYPGLIHTGDYLFLTDLDTDYNAVVHVFTADGAREVAAITLAHSATYLARSGKGVIAVGRRSTPYWTSHVTKITPQNGRFQTDHLDLGNGTIVESAVSDGSRTYFNEKGSRGIFRLSGRRLNQLPVEISGPGNNMILNGDKLYVVELRDLFNPGDESLAIIDLKTGSLKRVAGGYLFAGLRNVAALGNSIVGIESESNEAVLIDPIADEVLGRVSLKPGAYGIENYYQCAVAVMDDSKSLAFLKVQDGELTVVGGWDLNPAGDRLKQPRSLAVNEATGQIFVRSNYICPSCSVTQSSVFSFADNGEMAGLCQ